jgi:hypothetical protein
MKTRKANSYLNTHHYQKIIATIASLMLLASISFGFTHLAFAVDSNPEPSSFEDGSRGSPEAQSTDVLPEDPLNHQVDPPNSASSPNSADINSSTITPFSTTTNAREFSYHWFLRTPGHYCHPGRCYASIVLSVGYVYPWGDLVSYSWELRPALFLNLQSLVDGSNITKLQVGTCGNATDNGINCLRFGNYAFDIVGVNVGEFAEGKSGICEMTETDGYLDHDSQECPDMSVALLLSNQSATKFGQFPFRSYDNLASPDNWENANYYDGSNIKAAMENAYDVVKSGTLQGHASSATLESLIIPRDLRGGASTAATGGNKISGPNVTDAYFFPLSTTEAEHIFEGTASDAEEPPEVDFRVNQDDLIIAEVDRIPGRDFFVVFGGSGTGNYRLTASPADTCRMPAALGSPNEGKASAQLLKTGTCTITGTKAASPGHLASSVSMDINVYSVTHAMQTADDEGFEDLANQNHGSEGEQADNESIGGQSLTPQSELNVPQTQFYVAPTFIPLASQDSFERDGYHYEELCTEKSPTEGENCFPAGDEAKFTEQHGIVTLYPRWIANQGPFTPDNPAPPNTEMPANPDDPSWGTGKCSEAAWSEADCLEKGGIWTQLTGEDHLQNLEDALAESGASVWLIIWLTLGLASVGIMLGRRRPIKR